MEKKSLLYKFVLLSVAGLIGVGLIAFFMNFSPREEPLDIPEPAEEVAPVGYVVRLEGNTVNVYECSREGETYSKSLSEVNVYDLPEQIAENLRRGIEIENNIGLARLLEELSS